MEYEKNKPIKDVFKINFNLDEIPIDIRCSMHEWYNEMIQKTYYQLSVFDVTRMIIQKELLDVAVDRAIDYLSENPFEGQRYDGELLELLSDLKKYMSIERIQDIRNLLINIQPQINSFDWLSSEDCNEYTNIVNEFLKN